MAFMYKVSNQLVPSSISDVIPPLISEISNYPLRNSSNHIFIPTSHVISVSLWNSLDETVRTSSTMIHLKIVSNPFILIGPRQANLVLIAYASSEGSGEPAHSRSLARTFAARSYKQ